MNEPSAVNTPSSSLLEETPRIVTALALVVVLAAVVTSRPPPLAVLDGILFNYYNNSADPRALIYFNGWVQLVPEIVAYLARWLPMPAQIAAYLVVAAASAFVMQRELQKLLQLWLRGFEAAIISCAVLVYFQVYLPMLNQLVWCVWPLAVAACCHIVRKNIASEPFSWTGLAATAVACLTNPTAVVFVPLLGAFTLTVESPTLRRQNIALAVLLSVYFLGMFVLKPDDAQYISRNAIINAARAVWHLINGSFWRTLPVAAAVLTLAWLCTAAFRKSGDDMTRKAVLALVYVGFSSLALFLLSGRTEIMSSLPPRYTIICSVAAILALAIHAASRLDTRARQRLVWAIAIGVGFAEIYLLASRLPAQLRQASEQFAFARAVDDFRAACQPGEAITRHRKPPGLAILCVRIGIAEAANLPVARHDTFGNVFVAGPPAQLWLTNATVPIELLVPQR